MWVDRLHSVRRNTLTTPRYLPEDGNNVETQGLTPRKAVVETTAASEKSRKNSRKQQALEVVTSRKIRVGDELFLDYGVEYPFG